MIETVIAMALVSAAIMLLIPISRLIEDFPHVDWETLLIDIAASVVVAIVGAALVVLACMLLNALVFDPMKELLRLLSTAAAN